MGSVDGQLRPAFAKVETLHKKKGFTLLIITGDLFGTDDDDADLTALLNGEISVTLPTYFTVATRALPPRVIEKILADQDICENLHFLGKRSITKTSDGIRLVTLGGMLDDKIVAGLSTESHLPFHTPQDATSLRGAQSADILLTTMWPRGVTRGSKVPLGDKNTPGPSTREVAELCSALKPRYHLTLSPGPFFWMREPFTHPQKEELEKVMFTRFISMAPFGNAAKEKSLYAFSLPLKDTSVDIPIDATPSPFEYGGKMTQKRKGPDGYSRFEEDQGHRRSRRRKSPPPGPDRCYFCLSNSNFATHMICAIGDESFLATAKGPLPKSNTYEKEGVSFPGHIIIAPLAHESTIASMGPVSDPESVSVKTYKEMNRFRDALQAMVAKGSSFRLGGVTWEISRSTGIHVHWQFLATPADLIKSGLVEEAFKVEAQNFSYPHFQEDELPLEKQAEFGDYFRVWLWADDGEDKIKGKSLVMPLESDQPFNLQFARNVMTKLLEDKLHDRGLFGRASWKNCAQSQEEEEKDVEVLKGLFRGWDFT
jgi:hypothetical protein